MLGGEKRTEHNQGYGQHGHQAPLAVVQQVLEAHPPLGLAAHLALLSRLPLRGDHGGPLGEVVAEVLGDEAALGQDGGLGALGRSMRGEGQDGRLAERVDLLELRGREHGGLVAVVELDVVGEAQLLEEPEDALSPGEVEPGGCGQLKMPAGEFGRVVLTSRL